MQTEYSRLSDSQWFIIQPLLNNNKPRKHCLRQVIDAIRFLVRTGMQWRNLDEAKGPFPPWQSVYYYFRKWTKNNTMQLIMNTLTSQERKRQNRESTPSLLIVDSQSVKLAPFIWQSRGIDGNKKVNGRKRHIFTDTLGLPWAVYVGPANQHDGEAGLELLPKADKIGVERLTTIRADNAYRGVFKDASEWYGWETDTTQRPSEQKGFVPEKNRWQVERTFGWLNFYRRLSVDYERTPESSESMLALVAIDIILARLA